MSGETQRTKRDLVEENDALRRRLARLEALDGTAAPFDVAGNAVAHDRVLEAAGTFALELDERFMITHATPSIQAVLGYTPGEVIQQGYQDWVHEEDRDHLQERFVKLMASGESQAISCRLRHKNGQSKTFEIVACPYRNAEGALNLFAHLRDVSAVSQLDFSLRETRERIQLIDEMSRDMVLLIAKETGELIWANSGLTNLWGYTADDFKTEDDFSEKLDPDERERVYSMFYAALKEVGDSYSIEPFRFRHRDGSYGWYEGDDRLYQAETGERQVLSVIRDVSKTRRALEELRESEERYRILDGLKHDVILQQSDKNGRVIWANSALYDVLGYTKEDLTSVETQFSNVHPDDLKAARAAYDAVYPEVGTIIRYPITRCRHKDGSWRWLDGIEMICETERGERTMLSASRDVTKQIQAEEDRRILADRTHESQRLESLGVMAGGIAHDFNNLLTPIVGETSLALADLEPESALRPPLLKIQKAAHRAAALTYQMLAYSGQGALLIEPINLSLLVEEMGELLHSNISGGAVLSYSLAKDLPAIEADASQLSQIVMNLISNARESVEDGNGHIAIRTGVMAPSEVQREHIVGNSEVGSDPYVFLEVSDDGCGMAAETRLKIFDPFYSTKFTGRGLGLASVVGIVRGHRGLIVLESEVGRGTRFQVLLPAAKGSIAVQAVRPEQHSPWRSDGTVLVMDDDEGVRELAEITLQRAGFRVLLASDGREGLKLFHRHADEIRAVILDKTMPDISGNAVFEEIRRTQPDAAVILMSGYSEDRAIAQIGKHLNAFLQKPFEPSALLDIVRRVVTAKSK